MSGGFIGSSNAGFIPGPARKGPTLLQMLEQNYIKQQSHPHHTTLGSILHSAGHGIQSGLSFISRPSAAIAGAADAAVKGNYGSIGHGLVGGLEGHDHTGFGQVIQDAGLLKGHRTLRGLLGFVGDVATDPVMLASIAAAPVTGGSSLSLIAVREAEMGLAKGTLSRAARALLDSRATDEHVLSGARDVLREAVKKGPGFDLQAGLGEKRIAQLGQTATRQNADELHVLEAGAKAEHDTALGAKNLQLRYRVPFGRKIGMEDPFLKMDTKIKSPSLKRVADSTLLARVPVLNTIPKIADYIGKGFKPDWTDKSFHAMKMVGTRILEHTYDTNVHYMQKHLGEFYHGPGKISKDEVYHALHWGETTPGIVKGPTRKFNISVARRAVSSGQISKRQAEFLSSWHSVTEHMRLQDEEYGLKYDQPLKDVIYAPHLYTKTGNTISSMSSMLTKPGFEYSRLSSKATGIKDIHDLYQAGHYRKEIETDPQKLLSLRIRRGARAASEHTVRAAIAASTGIPTKIIDKNRLLARLVERNKRQQALKGLNNLANYDKLKEEVHSEAHNWWANRMHIEGERTRDKLRIHKSKAKNLKKRIAAFEKSFKGTKLEKGAKPVFLQSQLDRQEKAIKDTLSRFGAKQIKLANQHNIRRNNNLLKLDAKVNKEMNQYELHTRKINQLNSKLIKDYKANPSLFKRNPEAYKPGMVTEPKLRHENGGSLAIPDTMSQALHRIQGTTTNDEFLGEFRSVWQRLIGKWKIGVTVVNPGYRARNTMSDMWNMYVNNVPLWAIGRYGEKAAKYITQDLRYSKDLYSTPEKLQEGHRAAQILQEAFDHGILSGLFQGDIEKVIKFTSNKGSAKALIKSGHGIAAFTRIATTFNRHAENWGRLTHYLYLREHLGMSSADAAERVRATHFDYEDLTPTERTLKSNFIPFYTWTRKNIPFQISMLAQNPGRYSAFSKGINESEYASGDNKAQLVPSWMKSNLAFHVPFGGKGNMMIPQFGPSDIARLQQPTSNLLSMLSPLIKTPLELAFNKSLLTGAPVYGSQLSHPRAPISGLGAGLFSLLPGGNVGPTERTVGGKKMQGVGGNPVWSYLAGETPLSNIAVNQSSNIRSKQRGSGKAILSELTGLSTFNPDQQQQQAILGQQEQQAFKQFIRGLRDENKIPESKRKNSGYQLKRKTLLIKAGLGA